MNVRHDSDGIAVAVLMPHAPILVPGVGQGREEAASSSIAAMREVSRQVVARQPDRLVLISPHSPRRPGAFGLWTGSRLTGNLSRFGCDELGVDLPSDESFLNALTAVPASQALSYWRIEGTPLDHGAVVPLCLLAEAGWQGATSVIGLNYPGEPGLETLGQAVREAATSLGDAVAVVASGDMSHRLKEGAPAGYDPRAQAFDEAFVSLVRAGQSPSLKEIDPELQSLAAEDVVDSTRVALASVDHQARGRRVVSYEGPFGVGYCVAVLFDPNSVMESPSDAGHRLDELPHVARRALEAHFRGDSPAETWPDQTDDSTTPGVFVTLRMADGRLRGCRGTIIGRRPDVILETEAVALSSAFQDDRFKPLQPDEMADLHIEVSVLHQAEDIDSMDQLDPAQYGVILQTDDGRRGLMLPNVDGLDTTARQVEATRRKAGIDPSEPVRLQRFRVDKYVEAAPKPSPHQREDP